MFLLAMKRKNTDAHKLQVHSHEAVIAEYEKRAGRQKIYSAGMAVCVLFFFVYRIAFKDTWESEYGISFPSVVGSVLLAIALIFLMTWRNWRCPLCHSYLGMKMTEQKCPRCGIAFEKTLEKEKRFLRKDMDEL